MAKKTFKSGLDSLLSSTGLEKDTERTEKISEKKEISQKEQHWLLHKIERLRKELKLWRTGELNLDKFKASLEKNNLRYNPETNEIEENQKKN